LTAAGLERAISRANKRETPGDANANPSLAVHPNRIQEAPEEVVRPNE
jgi:hypothetical protein